jgi:hypothetical protein
MPGLVGQGGGAGGYDPTHQLALKSVVLSRAGERCGVFIGKAMLAVYHSVDYTQYRGGGGENCYEEKVFRREGVDGCCRETMWRNKYGS